MQMQSHTGSGARDPAGKRAADVGKGERDATRPPLRTRKWLCRKADQEARRRARDRLLEPL